MRKALVALSLTTVGFAASTAWLAYELWLVRTTDAAVAIAVAQPSAQPLAHSVAPITPLPVSAMQEAATPPTPGPETSPHLSVSTVHDARVQAATQAREFLATRDDPVRWRELIEREKSLQRTMNPTLARHLGLDAAAYDQFLETLVMQELAMREKVSRCAIDPNCQFPGFDQNFVESLERESSAAVGSELYARYAAFRDTRSERDTVTEMRGRLTDKDFLADAQAEQFALAMADERKRIERESISRRLNFGSFGNGNVLIYTSDDPAQAGAADDLNRRLRDRAAQILTPAQLLVYQQMQEEAMEGYRNIPRMQELANQGNP